jgi:murein L,D-transpeptidase YcbB/YkuD
MRMSIRRRRYGGIAITCVLAAIPLFIGCGPDREVRERITFATEDDAPDIEIGEGHAVRLPPDVRGFYRAREGEPLWINSRGLNARGRSAVEALGNAHTEGLDPDRYAVPMIETLADSGGDVDNQRRADRLRDLELLLTSRYLLYLEDLAIGSVEPQLSLPDSMWHLQRLESIASGEDPGDLSAGFLPPTEEYAALREALARYQAIADDGGWGTVLESEGAEAVSALRNRLIAEQDPVESALAAEAPAAASTLDAKLEQALRQFQTRHALEETGELDAATREALNVPVEDRLQSLRVTMDRWRALPRDFGDLYVFVNIPAYELRVVENDQQLLDMKVVVGKDVHPTPVMSDTMEYIVVNPYWNVPESILKAEILPAVREDENYLAKQNMEIVDREGDQPQVINTELVDFDDEEFPYHVRQRPGPSNALGRVKFMFPNAQNIYLHDTPAGALFDRTARAFSHGCVRVEKPMELAHLILGKTTDMTAAEFDALAGQGAEKHIRLDRGVPVYLAYLTAAVDDEGSVRFLPDLYDRDSTEDVAGAHAEPDAPSGERRVAGS